MRTLVTTILTVFTCFSALSGTAVDLAQTVKISEISYKEGIYYHKDQVFNGDMVDYYENEKLKFRYRVQDGRLNGEAIEFFSNGKTKSTRKYYMSKLFGQFTEYFETGEVKTSFEVKLNAYGSGELIEEITIGSLKKGRYKTKSFDSGIIYFLGSEGKVFESSELISILNQTAYRITDMEGEKTLLEVL